MTNNCRAIGAGLIAQCLLHHTPYDDQEKNGQSATKQKHQLGEHQSRRQCTREVVMYALGLLDVDYQFGGSNPGGGLRLLGHGLVYLSKRARD